MKKVKDKVKVKDIDVKERARRKTAVFEDLRVGAGAIEPTKTGPKTLWKMQPDTVAKLEAAFAIGCSTVEACAYADISQDSFYRWMKSNKEFAKLSERFNRLRQNPVLQARGTLLKGLKTDPDLALKFLKAKLPKEFKESVTIEGKSLHYHIVDLINKIEQGDDKNGTEHLPVYSEDEEQVVENGEPIQDKRQEP